MQTRSVQPSVPRFDHYVLPTFRTPNGKPERTRRHCSIASTAPKTETQRVLVPTDSEDLVTDNIEKIESMVFARKAHLPSLVLAMVNAGIENAALNKSQRHELVKISHAAWHDENLHVSSAVYAVASACGITDQPTFEKTLKRALKICHEAQPKAKWRPSHTNFSPIEILRAL